MVTERSNLGFIVRNPARLGNWTCRSFLNDPDVSKAANDLLLGEGTLERDGWELSGAA